MKSYIYEKGNEQLYITINGFNPVISYCKKEQFSESDINIFSFSGRNFTVDPGNHEINLLFEMRIGDRIYGLGEQPRSMNRSRMKITAWNTNAWEYNKKKTDTYLTVPFFIVAPDDHEENFIGVFVNSPAKVDFDFGNEEYDRIALKIHDESVEIFLLSYRQPSMVLKAYSDITGKPFKYPDWAFGHQISRWSYFPQEKVEEIVKRYLEEFPVSAIYLDIDYMDGYRVFTWDPKRFPDPEGMIMKLHSLGVKVIPIIDPGIKVDQNFPVFKKGLGSFLTRGNSDLYLGYVWPGLCAFPSFTNENSRSFWKNSIFSFAKIGVDGIWLDMNEPSTRSISSLDITRKTIDDDAFHHLDDGSLIPHEKIHNAYAYLEAEQTHEALKSLGKETFILSRSGYAGMQKYAAVWTGDNESSWEDLKLQISMVISLGLSGIPYSGCDLGGFAGESEPSLLAAYYEAALFFPLYRNHKIKGGNDQELFLLPERIKKRIKDAIDLRYKFIPYLKKCRDDAMKDGEPIIRPLFYNYPDDRESYLVDDEYMVGHCILYAPVLDKSPGREIYLPPGQWIHFNSGIEVSEPGYFDGRTNIFIRKECSESVLKIIGKQFNAK